MARFLALLLTVLVLAPPPVTAAEEDIVKRLKAIPGMSVVAERGAPAEYRFLSLSYRQPVDHDQPSAGTFEQRFTLLHKASDQPMIAHTSGYDVYYDRPFRSELTFLLNTNQISVEQRFFTPSRPQPVDWRKLTIRQAAADHHRLFSALKSIYTRKWISTGESKGGMASVYHRRFYPSDVDATVAFVAPNDVDNAVDSYAEFLRTVGTATCRGTLDTLQREALKRRTEIVGRYSAWAQTNGRTFTRSTGSADRAFELLVLDTPWTFWQRKFEYHCRSAPTAAASTDELYRYLDSLIGFDTFTDQGIESYVPYYYQAGTQLGWGSLETPHLDGLLRYPGLYQPRTYVPRDIPMTFDPNAMADVDSWVRGQGTRLMFVYGQNDPWGAEPFRLGSGSVDSLWFQVAGGNHDSDIRDLPAGQRATAEAAIRRWAGVSATVRSSHVAGLDDWRPSRR